MRAMGDRSNIFFRTKGGGIGVYAHWSGLAMADAAARVAKSKAFKARVGDRNYAMRIGVQLVLETLGAESDSETGFGLWMPATGPDDNEYRYVVVDVDTGALFVTSNWKTPKPSERLANPTAGAIRARMRGAPEKKPKRAPRKRKK